MNPSRALKPRSSSQSSWRPILPQRVLRPRRPLRRLRILLWKRRRLLPDGALGDRRGPRASASWLDCLAGRSLRAQLGRRRAQLGPLRALLEPWRFWRHPGERARPLRRPLLPGGDPVGGDGSARQLERLLQARVAANAGHGMPGRRGPGTHLGPASANWRDDRLVLAGQAAPCGIAAGKTLHPSEMQTHGTPLQYVPGEALLLRRLPSQRHEPEHGEPGPRPFLRGPPSTTVLRSWISPTPHCGPALHSWLR